MAVPLEPRPGISKKTHSKHLSKAIFGIITMNEWKNSKKVKLVLIDRNGYLLCNINGFEVYKDKQEEMNRYVKCDDNYHKIK